jgi:hypothetical protein
LSTSASGESRIRWLNAALIFTLDQAADTLGKMAGKHGNLALGKINRGAAGHRLLKERVARPHIVGHIGDMNSHQVVAVLLLDAQGIVKIQRGDPVDGERLQMGEVEPVGIGKELLIAGAQQTFGLMTRGHGKGDGKLMAKQPDVDVFRPEAAFHQNMIGVMRAVVTGLLEDERPGICIFGFLAEEIVVLHEGKDVLLALGKGRRLFALIADSCQQGAGLVDKGALFSFFFPLVFELLHFFRGVRCYLAFPIFEKEAITKHRAQKGAHQIIVGGAAEHKLGEKGRLEGLTVFRDNQLP